MSIPKWVGGLVVLLAVSFSPALGAITADATTSTTSLASTTVTWSHTVGSGSNRILVVGVSTYGKNGHITVSSITYGGTSLTQIGSLGHSTDNEVMELWYLLAPAVGAANVIVTLSGAHPCVAGALSYFGVSQTTPFGTFASAQGTSTAPSVTVTSASGQIVIDTMATQGDALSSAAGAGQTQKWNTDTGKNDSKNARGAGSTEAGAASVTMSWTLGASKPWVTGAVPLIPAIYQPDAMIKLDSEADGSYLTDNTYETTASAQSKSQSKVTTSTATYYVKFQNDGNTTDDITIAGTAGTASFTVQYLDDGATDRTTAVTGSGYPISSLAAGASKVWTLKVTPTSSAADASSYTVYVTAASQGDTSKVDQVKAVTTAISYRPDAMIKLSSEADGNYLTDNTYESSASVQSKSGAVVSGSAAVYTVKFQNDCSTADSLKITGTATGSNFTVQYLDDTSTDRTAAVTGAGYTIGSLAGGASKVWTFNVTPSGSSPHVDGGTSYTVFVTATSQGDTGRVDQVKAVTTSTSAKLTLVKSRDKATAAPGDDVTYTIDASNGSGLTNASTIVVTDPIPSSTGFKMSGASFNAGTSGLTCEAGCLTYSNNGGATWTYTPASGGCSAPAGYDGCVTNVKWKMTGSMPTGTAFSVGLVVRVK